MLQLPVIFHPIYSQLKLAKNHRFPIEKYQALHDQALADHGQQLKVIAVKNIIKKSQLETVHDINYIDTFLTGEIAEKAMKRIGFPWSEQFVKRTLTAVSGTLLTANTAAEYGVAINLTGGYHHAHPDFGSGFCVFNDLTLAAKQLIAQGKASRVLIFDCDVHQGDGTATCAEQSPEIFSCSIHCEKNFPARKQNSDWDIGLKKALSDDEYLAEVNNALEAAVNSFKPDFILYDAGVDIHENDDLGLLKISTAGVFTRDKIVFTKAKDMGIPVAAVIGGGYQRDIAALTQVHMQLIHAAIEVFVNKK